MNLPAPNHFRLAWHSLGEKYLIEAQSREDTTDAVKAPEDSKAFYPFQMRECIPLRIPWPSGFVILKIKFFKNLIILLLEQWHHQMKENLALWLKLHSFRGQLSYLCLLLYLSGIQTMHSIWGFTEGWPQRNFAADTEDSSLSWQCSQRSRVNSCAHQSLLSLNCSHAQIQAILAFTDLHMDKVQTTKESPNLPRLD